MNPLQSVYTSNLPGILTELGISLIVSTYQAGKVIIIRPENGQINTHFRDLAQPMGIAAHGDQLAIGADRTIWLFQDLPDVAKKLEPAGTYDTCYIPRQVHITGDIDVHEMAWADDDLWIVNTRFCCLCTLDPRFSFRPRWRPHFVTSLAPQDRCHLNGLAVVDNTPRYVTALGSTDSPGGWRENKRDGGVLMDVDRNEIIFDHLSMPHSPRHYLGRLWFLESGKGQLVVADPDLRSYRTVASFPGYPRGLDFVGPLAFVGLSKLRDNALFSGIPLAEQLDEQICGIWVVNIETGKIIALLRFENDIREIFAVKVLAADYPEMLTWDDKRTASSYVLPWDTWADGFTNAK